MRMQLLVDADEFWPSLERDIASARERVYIQTMSFEGDSVGQRLAATLEACHARDRRVIADEFYTVHRINDKYLYNLKRVFNNTVIAERNATLRMLEKLESKGVGVKLANPSGFFTERFLHRNHKKMMVIDDRIAYIGGINFSEHNFEWHDLMLRIEDEALSRFLREDFETTWSGVNANTSQRFGPIELYRFDAKNNPKTFRPLIELLRNARKSIYIISPYITFPFYEPLVEARRNGARVVLITPDQNNWRTVKEYTLWERERTGVEVQMYHGKMVHMKAILIDDKYLIVGSCNFDFLSWQLLQEIVGVVTDPGAIADFKRRILDKDLERSTPATETVSNLRGYYHKIRLILLRSIFRTVARIVPPGRFVFGTGSKFR